MIKTFLAVGVIIQIIVIVLGMIQIIESWWLVFSPTIFVVADFLIMAIIEGIVRLQEDFKKEK